MTIHRTRIGPTKALMLASLLACQIPITLGASSAKAQDTEPGREAQAETDAGAQPEPEAEAEAEAEASAAPWEIRIAGGADVTVAPALTGHGFLLAEAQREWEGHGRVVLTYNTDTLDATLRRHPLGEHLHLTAGVRGEVFIAGLLTDYFQGGERIAERGFYASYVQAHAAVQAHLPRHMALELGLRFRQLFFRDNGDTSDSLVLPEDTWQLRPHVAFVYWNLSSGGEEWEAHRLFPRIEGIAFRLAGELFARGAPSAFGIPDAPGVPERRNDVGRLAGTARAWLGVGGRVGPLRLAFELSAAYGAGHDDITRDRLGGMNPYVVRIPGLPWASLLSARYLVAEGRGAWVIGRHEVGASVAAGALADPGRVGDFDEIGAVLGLGAFADLRFGRFQLHLRGGYAPPQDWLIDNPHLSGFAAIGVRLR